jgi:hypothetical protein
MGVINSIAYSITDLKILYEKTAGNRVLVKTNRVLKSGIELNVAGGRNIMNP